MSKLDKIATLCRDLECVFTINNDWSGNKDSPQIFYEWRIEGSQRGDSNACGGFRQLNDCLLDCLKWLMKVKNSR